MGRKLDTFDGKGNLISSVDTRTADDLERERARPFLEEIDRLEAQVTQRRLREAITGVDGGWLADQENLIGRERAKL